MPAVKPGSGGVVIQACFAATGPGHQSLSQFSSVCQGILQSNMRPRKTKKNQIDAMAKSKYRQPDLLRRDLKIAAY